MINVIKTMPEKDLDLADLAGPLTFIRLFGDEYLKRLREALWDLMGYGKSKSYDIPETEVKFLELVEEARLAFEYGKLTVREFAERMAIIAGDREAELREELQSAGAQLSNLYLGTESRINKEAAISLPIDAETFTQFADWGWVLESVRNELIAQGIDVTDQAMAEHMEVPLEDLKPVLDLDAEVMAMLEALESPGYFIDLARCRVSNVCRLVEAMDMH